MPVEYEGGLIPWAVVSTDNKARVKREDRWEGRLDQSVNDLAQISSKPNLHALSYALRHPEMWPTGFYWNYRACTNCAVGLAMRLWPNNYEPISRVGDERVTEKKSWIAREMAMPYRQAESIFFKMGTTWLDRVKGRDMDNITSDDVADAIDRYLAKAE